MQRETVSIRRFFEEYKKDLKLELVAGENGLDRIIREPTVNRPGLMLAGFTKYFAYRRIQVIGNAEAHYLRSLPAKARHSRFKQLLQFKVPCVVFCRNLPIEKTWRESAKQYATPLLQSSLVTMNFINKATLALETLFAPYTLLQGSMVDILGIGVLICGESGIGKSESVLALIERGYSLVSDDITKVVLTGNELYGYSPEVTRDFMEVRGIGIINVPATFGIRSIRRRKKLDLVVTLKAWEKVPDIDRLGMSPQFTKILGVEVPHITIPVRPGRDIARLIEVAALHQKLIASGFKPAEALNKKVLAHMKRLKEPKSAIASDPE